MTRPGLAVACILWSIWWGGVAGFAYQRQFTEPATFLVPLRPPWRLTFYSEMAVQTRYAKTSCGTLLLLNGTTLCRFHPPHSYTRSYDFAGGTHCWRSLGDDFGFPRLSGLRKYGRAAPRRGRRSAEGAEVAEPLLKLF